MPTDAQSSQAAPERTLATRGIRCRCCSIALRRAGAIASWFFSRDQLDSGQRLAGNKHRLEIERAGDFGNRAQPRIDGAALDLR